MNIERNRRRLTGHRYEGLAFEGLDLRGALAESSLWINCTFDRVKFGQAALGNGTFQGCRFTDCDFGQATLISRLYRCAFTDCDFSQALFAGADIQATTFAHCRFQYANFQRATLTDVGLIDCDLHGAALDFAVSRRVDFSGSSLWGALIPLNCAMFVGNTFDRRQVHHLLALLCHGKGGWREGLVPHVDRASQKLVTRLVGTFLDEEVAEAGAPRVDQFGRDATEVDSETNEERDRGVAPGEGRFPRRVGELVAEREPR